MSSLLRSPWCRFGIAFVTLIAGALALASLDHGAEASQSAAATQATSGCAAPAADVAGGDGAESPALASR